MNHLYKTPFNKRIVVAIYSLLTSTIVSAASNQELPNYISYDNLPSGISAWIGNGVMVGALESDFAQLFTRENLFVAQARTTNSGSYIALDGTSSTISFDYNGNNKVNVFDATQTTTTLHSVNGSTVTLSSQETTIGGVNDAKTIFNRNGGVNFAGDGTNQKLNGVADGEISATSKEAINGSQLYAVLNAPRDVPNLDSTIINLQNEFNGRFDQLDQKINEGLAMSAALNGLFQPYNIGRFNASVAVGGYNSEHAIAAGSGYRFNESFAMKTGIAFTQGGQGKVSYNVGANFEW